MSASMMTDVSGILEFIRGGNATITLVSQRTQKRYTFRIRKPNDNAPFFVSIMYGSDNETSYAYAGILTNDNCLKLTQKSKFGVSDIRVQAFSYFLQCLRRGEINPELEVWHEGRCGRCNRKLTVPESIASGFGPECVKAIRG